MLVYLLGVTKDVVAEDGLSPYLGVAGGELITHTIAAGFYDVALHLVEKYPDLATEINRRGITALRRLAAKPKDFPSGRSYWFWHNFICFWIPTESGGGIGLNMDSQNVVSQSISRIHKLGCSGLRYCTSLLRLLAVVTLVNGIGHSKQIHKQTDQLMKAICTTIMNTRDYTTVWEVLGPATYAAAIHGIHELIEEYLCCYPGLVWY